MYRTHKFTVFIAIVVVNFCLLATAGCVGVLSADIKRAYATTKMLISKNDWEGAKASFDHLESLTEHSKEVKDAFDLYTLKKHINELIQLNLGRLYQEGETQLRNAEYRKAFQTFKRILSYNDTNEEARSLLNLAREKQEALIKTTVTSKAPDVTLTGLRVYNPKKCYNGYTLFAHRTLQLSGIETFLMPIYLIDMEGNIVHQWMVNPDTILARLKPDGNLVYINGGELIEVAPDSQRVWAYEGCIDHAFQILDDGNFLVNRLEGDIRSGEGYCGKDALTCIAIIEILTRDKKVIWKWKFDEHIHEIRRFAGIEPILKPAGTKFNSSEILKDTPIGKYDARFRKGNILLSLNLYNLIGILDYPTGKIVWMWPWGANVIQSQHAPTMLDNGNILIFDNGKDRGWSRVIELNPLTEEIVWEYHAEPKEDFFSPTLANATRLANGNTLICEGTKNRIFEITPEGEIVWDFISTFNKTTGSECIYQAFRYSPDYVKPLLERIKNCDIAQHEPGK